MPLAVSTACLQLQFFRRRDLDGAYVSLYPWSCFGLCISSQALLSCLPVDSVNFPKPFQ